MKLVAALVLALTLSGCISVSATRLGGGPIRPAISPDQVVIYRTPQQVNRQYEEVALLNAAGDSDLTNEEMMYNKMRKKAGEIGANGIILDSISEPTTGAKVANALLGTSANRKGKAVAIYVAPQSEEK